MSSRILEVTFGGLPPSDNHIREPKFFKTRGRLKSTIGYTAEADGYKRKFKDHISRTFFVDIQKFVKGHRPGMTYMLTISLFFPAEKVLNEGWLKKYKRGEKAARGERYAKSPYKRLDSLNRRKLLEDAFSEAIALDDHLWWEGRVVRYVVDDPEEAGVGLTLVETNPGQYGIPSPFWR